MGLSFLAPFFLLGLVAIAIPIFIHLTHRQRKDAVPFPSLMFLSQIPFRTTRRQRIRNWLLFLLRCAAIVLLVGAFAHPLLDSGAQTASGLAQARETVVLLDRSYSMAYGDRWQRARDAARRIVADMGAEDRLSLILFAERTEAAATSSVDPAVLQAAIEDAGILPQVTRVAPALRLARQTLERTDRPRRELVLISDFQRSGWEGEGGIRFPEGTVIAAVDLSDASVENVAVTGVSLIRARVEERDMAAVSARLANLSRQAARDLQVTLEIDGETVQTQNVNVDPGGAVTVAFSSLVVPRRSTSAVVRAGSDALPGDNSFHFVIRPEDRVRVLIVYPPTARDDDNLYLRRAFAVGGSPGVQLTVRPLSRLNRSDLEGTDLVILNDALVPSGAAGRQLRSLVEEGGGLLVVLGRRSSPGAWTAEARSFLPAAPGSAIDRSADAGGTLSFLDRDHPAFELFRSPRSGDFSVARFFRYRRLTASEDAAVLATFDDGAPALLERQQGQGRVAVWASDFANYWNDLVLQPVFVPFLHQVARYLAGYVEPQLAFRVGEIIDLAKDPTLGEGIQSGGGELVVEAPSGEREVRRVEADAPFLQLDEVGSYQVRYLGGGRDQSLLAAANLDREESDLASLDPEEVIGALRSEGGDEVVTAELLELSPEERERRQGLWWYLLLAMGAILVGETVISNRVPAARRRN